MYIKQHYDRTRDMWRAFCANDMLWKCNHAIACHWLRIAVYQQCVWSHLILRPTGPWALCWSQTEHTCVAALYWVWHRARSVLHNVYTSPDVIWAAVRKDVVSLIRIFWKRHLIAFAFPAWWLVCDRKNCLRGGKWEEIPPPPKKK